MKHEKSGDRHTDIQTHTHTDRQTTPARGRIIVADGIYSVGDKNGSVCDKIDLLSEKCQDWSKITSILGVAPLLVYHRLHASRHWFIELLQVVGSDGVPNLRHNLFEKSVNGAPIELELSGTLKPTFLSSIIALFSPEESWGIVQEEKNQKF